MQLGRPRYPETNTENKPIILSLSGFCVFLLPTLFTLGGNIETLLGQIRRVTAGCGSIYIEIITIIDLK